MPAWKFFVSHIASTIWHCWVARLGILVGTLDHINFFFLFYLTFTHFIRHRASFRGILLHTSRNRTIWYYTGQSWCFWARRDQWTDLFEDFYGQSPEWLHISCYSYHFLAYGGCARNTSGSQNQPVLLKDRIIVSNTANQKKDDA